MAGPFKLRSGNGPLKFKNMGSSPVKHEGKIKTVDSGPPDYKVTGYSHVNEDGGVSTAKTVEGLHEGAISHAESDAVETYVRQRRGSSRKSEKKEEKE